MMHDDENVLLDTRQAADELNTSVRFLEAARKRGIGPKHVKLGPKTIRYTRRDLRQYVRERTIGGAK